MRGRAILLCRWVVAFLRRTVTLLGGTEGLLRGTVALLWWAIRFFRLIETLARRAKLRRSESIFLLFWFVASFWWFSLTGTFFEKC